MASVRFLDVKEVGRSAYLFVLNCNTQHSEYAGGKGEEGKEGERSVRASARACVQVDNWGKHGRAVSCHTAETQRKEAMH